MMGNASANRARTSFVTRVTRLAPLEGKLCVTEFTSEYPQYLTHKTDNSTPASSVGKA